MKYILLFAFIFSFETQGAVLAELLGTYHGKEVYSGKDCSVKIKEPFAGKVKISVSEERFIFDKVVTQAYPLAMVEQRIPFAEERGYVALRVDYGTPSREAFTRVELVFENGKFVRAETLKYKNLNYTTKSTAIYCGKLRKR